MVQGHTVELDLSMAEAKGLLLQISAYVEGLTPDELEAWPGVMLKPAPKATHVRIAGREYPLKKERRKKPPSAPE